MADPGRDEAFGAPVQPGGGDAVHRAGATRSRGGLDAFDDDSASTVAEAYALTDAIDVAGSAEVIAESASGGAEAVVGRWSTPAGRFLRSVLAIGVFLVVLAVAWELFKWLFGDPWRYPDVLGTGIDVEHFPPFKLSQASDLSLPHVWDIASALAQPFQRGSDMTLGGYLVDAAFYTWRDAAIGFSLGTLIGILLATLFVHSGLAERAFLPWVIASQTVPIVALAPLLVVALGTGLVSVVVIATYLTFFPVTIAETRGLRSPDPRALELMRSYAASKRSTFWKVRLPASVPYLFTALKIAAVASIVGAIIGEGPGGVKNGLGRAIVVYFQQYITGPEKLWATIIAASLTGIAFFLAIRVAEVVLLRGRQSLNA
jgi:NitT/TauT family transport system permease protein